MAKNKGQAGQGGGKNTPHAHRSNVHNSNHESHGATKNNRANQLNSNNFRYQGKK